MTKRLVWVEPPRMATSLAAFKTRRDLKRGRSIWSAYCAWLTAVFFPRAPTDTYSLGTLRHFVSLYLKRWISSHYEESWFVFTILLGLRKFARVLQFIKTHYTFVQFFAFYNLIYIFPSLRPSIPANIHAKFQLDTSISVVFLIEAEPRSGNVLFSLLSSSTGPSPGLENIWLVIPYCSFLRLVPLDIVDSWVPSSLCTEKPCLSRNVDRLFCVESRKRKRGRIVDKHAAIIAMFSSRLFLNLVRRMIYA